MCDAHASVVRRVPSPVDQTFDSAPPADQTFDSAPPDDRHVIFEQNLARQSDNTRSPTMPGSVERTQESLELRQSSLRISGVEDQVSRQISFGMIHEAVRDMVSEQALPRTRRVSEMTSVFPRTRLEREMSSALPRPRRLVSEMPSALPRSRLPIEMTSAFPRIRLMVSDPITQYALDQFHQTGQAMSDVRSRVPFGNVYSLDTPPDDAECAICLGDGIDPDLDSVDSSDTDDSDLALDDSDLDGPIAVDERAVGWCRHVAGCKQWFHIACGKRWHRMGRGCALCRA